MRVRTKRLRTEGRSPSNTKEQTIEWNDDIFKDWFGEENSSSVMLRGLRHREGLTQVQFGDILGIAQANISLMERGKRSIGKQVAKRVAARFQIDYRLFL